MVAAAKIPSLSLPPLVSRNSLGIGHAGVWPSKRATARGLKTSMPCWASPPITFCQDQVTTSSRSQARSMANAADVASQMVSPVRAGSIQLPSGTRTPDVVPFQVNTTSRSKEISVKSGSAP